MGIIAMLMACSSPTEPPRPSQPRPLSPLPSIPFTIQVGAFSTSAGASRLAAGLVTRGLDAYFFIDNDGLYKVRFERFQTKDAARSRAIALKHKGTIGDFYIVQPASDAHRADPQARLRTDLVATARRFLGTPYRWGGASADGGFDCSGLTMTVYRLNGMQLPRSSRSQFNIGQFAPRKRLQPGDLVFFATETKGRVSHVGIYTGKGQFIHAPGKGKQIQTASIDDHYFRARYMGARRYF
jgi:cell wall-associated NlpC family hydrolase